MLDERRLEEIRARCEAATPGPWEFGQCGADGGTSGKASDKPDLDFVVVNAPPGEGSWDVVAGVSRDDCGEDPDIFREVASNYHFIAHARQDLPDLLAEVLELRAVLAAHDLCHDLHGKVDVQDFAKGCAAEQRKLYGCAPDADAAARLLADNAALRARVAELEAASARFQEIAHHFRHCRDCGEGPPCHEGERMGEELSAAVVMPPPSA